MVMLQLCPLIKQWYYNKDYGIPRVFQIFFWAILKWEVCFQEYEIDKKLQIKSPEDVAAMGIQKYNTECRGIVSRYAKEWEVSNESLFLFMAINKSLLKALWADS